LQTAKALDNAPAHEIPDGSAALNGFKALCRLAVWATKFTPLVSIDEELLSAFREKKLPAADPLYNGLILDITGTSRVHRSEETLLQRLLHCFSKKQITVRLAIAPTVGAAWALSRFGKNQTSVVNSRPALALAPLPIQALRIPQETIASLNQLGIHHIADLLKLPKEKLATRFGPLLLKRLEQALGVGQSPEPLRFIHLERPFSARRNFEIPLNNHAILKTALIDLLREVMFELVEKKKKAGIFTIELKSRQKNGNCYSIKKDLTLFQATNNLAHLNSVIQPIIESLQVKEGITAVQITARLISRIVNAQEKLVPHGQTFAGQESAAELINHLVARLGATKVAQVSFSASYLPEKSFYYQPIQEHSDSPAVTPPLAERPPYLFSPPQLISAVALLPDNPPLQIRWQGKLLPLVRGFGPERINTEWWHTKIDNGSALKGRDYFRVQEQSGRWLWVFRDHTTLHWFVHGVWV